METLSEISSLDIVSFEMHGILTLVNQKKSNISIMSIF